MRVEQRSDLPGRVEWSSGLKVEWSSKQWKQEMGCSLTSLELRLEQSSRQSGVWNSGSMRWGIPSLQRSSGGVRDNVRVKSGDGHIGNTSLR